MFHMYDIGLAYRITKFIWVARSISYNINKFRFIFVQGNFH